MTKAPTPAIHPPMRHLLAFRSSCISSPRTTGNRFPDARPWPWEDRKCLDLTDAFTKFAMAVPCKDQSAGAVAKSLQEQWFVHYGVPLQIHSDREETLKVGSYKS